MRTDKSESAVTPDLPYKQTVQMLEQACRDPRMADQLLALQRMLIDELTDIARDVRHALPSPPSAKADSISGRPVTASTLQGEGRNRQAAATQHNELIEDLLAGALLNQRNPDWNPLDPATSKENRESLLLAILNMRIGGNGAG